MTPPLKVFVSESIDEKCILDELPMIISDRSPYDRVFHFLVMDKSSYASVSVRWSEKVLNCKSVHQPIIKVNQTLLKLFEALYCPFYRSETEQSETQAFQKNQLCRWLKS